MNVSDKIIEVIEDQGLRWFGHLKRIGRQNFKNDNGMPRAERIKGGLGNSGWME